jgi:hypothetical protein
MRVVGDLEVAYGSSFGYVFVFLRAYSELMTTCSKAIPHRVLQEDEYRGYRIPANSTVISNMYGVRSPTAISSCSHLSYFYFT